MALQIDTKIKENVMIKWMKILVKSCIQKYKIGKIKKTYGLQTKSKYVSPQAKYGRNNRIGQNVVIDDDVILGDYTYVNKNSSLEHCIVGKFCSISEGVKINPVEHNLNLITTHPVAGDNGHYNMERKSVAIGNDVLISMNAIILSGVTIGDGAVIGAGAVVTKDVEPYEVVGGVPAKHIKFRFGEEKRKELQNVQWWNWDIEKIHRNIQFLRCETDMINEEK